ncbi:hypothetical protein GCM10011571_15800 [Marinithermofilum abyssi]|uniref:Polymer-forming cytoskeletal protein n=2 Tax=Marinithermofilum abyssi TaxID=1571185 RepID=A0A8J2VHB0_9BACL|nr:hypothetical protein GCM10011571_15800 [Marinithermofilum abyssi]
MEGLWMKTGSKNNLVIAGSGSTSGGNYNDVKINGEGRVNGDLECVHFRTNGKSEVKGGIQAESVQVHGVSKVAGEVKVQQFKVNGHAEVQADVKSEEVKVYGYAEIKGRLSSEEVEIKGGVSIKGDCEAERFSVKGGFHIEHMLNAGNIAIDLYRTSKVKEIGGEKITIRKPSHSLLDKVKMIFNLSGELSAESIEGDDIYLEHTRAKVVRGNHIHIGPGCEIDRVEYKGSFKSDKEAKVRDCVQQ